jgi:hypothetical protein
MGQKRHISDHLRVNAPYPCLGCRVASSFDKLRMRNTRPVRTE